MRQHAVREFSPWPVGWTYCGERRAFEIGVCTGAHCVAKAVRDLAAVEYWWSSAETFLLLRIYAGHLPGIRHFHIFGDAKQGPDFLRRSRNHNLWEHKVRQV